MLSLVTAVEDERGGDAGPAGRRVPGLCLHADGLANTPQSLAFKSRIVSGRLGTMGAIPLGLAAGQRLRVQHCIDSGRASTKIFFGLKIKAIVLGKN